MKSTNPNEINRRKELARVLREMRVAARTDPVLNHALNWKYQYQRANRERFVEMGKRMVQKWM